MYQIQRLIGFVGHCVRSVFYADSQSCAVVLSNVNLIRAVIATACYHIAAEVRIVRGMIFDFY